MAQIIVCDVCETRENVNRKHYAFDRQSDGAGGREDVCELFDLCQVHELLALSRAFKAAICKNISTEYDMNRLIIAEIKKIRK